MRSWSRGTVEGQLGPKVSSDPLLLGQHYSPHPRNPRARLAAPRASGIAKHVTAGAKGLPGQRPVGGVFPNPKFLSSSVLLS